MPISADKQASLEKKFKKFDKNGDGVLSLEEIKSLLLQGDPSMSNQELQVLFNGIDKNGDGKVDFKEFVNYIYADVPELPANVVACFMAFAGKNGELEGKEFLKMMNEADMYDKSFKKTDVDMIFCKQKSKSKQGIDKDKFSDCLKEIAQRKNIPIVQVFNKIVAAGGPDIAGTQADAVRFHDDKSTYTGAHARDGRHGYAGSNETRVRDQDDPQLDTQTDLSALEGMFGLFAGKDMSLDGKEFVKMMKDCGILDQSFGPTQCDLVFAKVVPHGQRRIGFEEFQDAIRRIGHTKSVPLPELKVKISNSNGPLLTGTKADDVRFHDDKSTYTGMHKGK
jgi:hypothetical protein